MVSMKSMAFLEDENLQSRVSLAAYSHLEDRSEHVFKRSSVAECLCF